MHAHRKRALERMPSAFLLTTRLAVSRPSSMSSGPLLATPSSVPSPSSMFPRMPRIRASAAPLPKRPLAFSQGLHTLSCFHTLRAEGACGHIRLCISPPHVLCLLNIVRDKMGLQMYKRHSYLQINHKKN